MPEIHLRQPGFTYSACGPFTNKKERIQKFKETRDSRYIYQKDKFIHDKFITNAFEKTLDKSRHKPNKIWLDKGSEFYNKSMKSWLVNNCMEMYSIHND